MARMGQSQPNQRNVNPRTDGKPPHCKHCKRTNHKTADCLFKNNVSCEKCGKIGHLTSNCWSNNPRQTSGNTAKAQSSGNTNSAGKARAEQTASIVEVPEKTSGWDGTFSTAEKLTTIVEQPIIEAKEQSTKDIPAKLVEPLTQNDDELIDFLTDDEEDMKEFRKTYQSVCDSYANKKAASLYEWLADSATTSHVANRQEFFAEYKPQSGASVSGVGNTTVTVEGRGTVILESECEGLKHVLRLQNVLHIPNNKNNLISLGRWEAAGAEYRGRNGQLAMITADGRTVAIGKRVENHLYKMQVNVRMQRDDAPTMGARSFVATEPSESWETWHKRFGHVSYSGLKRLWEKNLVDGFNVDTNTPIPDCVACTEAKQTEEPYNKRENRQTMPGELTHIDLWGKYNITSINGHQYYILFVDDAS
jgi:hypothetical protein